MTSLCCFFVPGLAQTKGSAKGFAMPNKKRPGKYRAVIVNDNPKAKGWQASVKMVAELAMGARPPVDGPVRITMAFQMPRGSTVKRETPCVRPDLSKLYRCAEDGLTGVCFKDDAQVIEATLTKTYGEPGVVIEVFH